MASKVVVKDYMPELKDEVVRVAYRAFENSMDPYWASRYLDKCDKAFVALVDSKVVGAVELGYIHLRDGLHAQIGYIFVDPKYRKIGVGSALVAKSIEFLASKNVKAVWALTSPENVAARKLFKKFGFKEFYSPKELKGILSRRDIGKLLYKMIYWRGDIILFKPLKNI